MLDSEEYLHLAIHASQNNAIHSALEYLHKSLELSPDNGKALFLLGAQYAELNLYKRAIDCMEKSLRFDPELEMAYYQLGLLYLQVGRTDDSHRIWQSLASRQQGTPLEIFARGMIMLESDRDSAVSMIDQALAMQQGNPALQDSIQKVLAMINTAAAPDTGRNIDESYSAYLLDAAYKTPKFNSEDN